MLSFPRYILDYRIKASSKTEDLLTLGRLFSEVGDYASTIQQRTYALMARMCRTRLRKIEHELLRRSAIRTPEDLLTPPSPLSTSSHNLSSTISNLSNLTISELETLYRQRPLRTEARIAEGHEHLTLFFETRIVIELSRRIPSDLTEQLKIDYCLLIHQVELANLSAILNLPLGNPKDCLLFDPTHTYTPSELIAMLTLYQSPRTLTEREILIETADNALNLLSTTSPSSLQPLANLTALLVELHRRKILRCSHKIYDLLLEVIRTQQLRQVADTELVFPLLTAAIVTKDWSLQRKAQCIINRCWRACKGGDYTLNQLYTAVYYCSYISRFNIRYATVCWNRICEKLILKLSEVSTKELIKLLETAKELEDSALGVYSLKQGLTEAIENRVGYNDFEATIYLCRRLRDCSNVKAIAG